jgi:hypothetical protein
LLVLFYFTVYNLIDPIFFHFFDRYSVVFYYLFFVFFIYKSTNELKYKYLFFFISIFQVVLIIWVLYYDNNKIPFVPFAVANFCILVLSCFYYFNELFKDEYTCWRNNSAFIIISGNSISSILMIPTSVFVYYFYLSPSINFYNIIYSIMGLSMFVQYLSFSIAIYVQP